jgi:cell wall-associated NlpC family hydrolase
MPIRLRILLLACAFAFTAVAFGWAAQSTTTTHEVVIDTTQVKSARYRKKRPKPSLGERAAKIALSAVGVPYRWGGTSLASGFDCSGLVYWAYHRLGIDVPHSSYALFDVGRAVRPSRMRPGDVLFFSGLGHVGLYIGRGRMVHAPHSGTDVQIVTLRRSNYGSRLVGARRIAAA